MPKDEISNPRKAPTLTIDDADDEVIDLLEVVKPGRKVTQNAGNDDGDFSADLDAMLDGLSGTEQAERDLPDKPEPFPDPTPVDHKVDHDETLDLPGMDDLDNLLKSFRTAGADSDSEETDEPDFSGLDLNMPDLDAMPITPVPPKKAPPSTPPPPAPKGVAEARPAPKAAPATEDDELFASLLAGGDPPPPAGKVGKTPHPPAAEREDDLFADLDLALGAASDDAPASPAEDVDLLGNLGLPSLETDDNAPADTDDLGLEDLNLDSLGLEDDEPPTQPALEDDLDLAPADTDGLGLEDLNLDSLGLGDDEPPAPPKAPAPKAAKAPAQPALEDDLDLALADTEDLGLEDLTLDSLGLDDDEPGSKEVELVGPGDDAAAPDALDFDLPELDEQDSPDSATEELNQGELDALGLEEPDSAPPDLEVAGASVLAEDDGLDLEDRDEASLGEVVLEPAELVGTPEEEPVLAEIEEDTPDIEALEVFQAAETKPAAVPKPQAPAPVKTVAPLPESPSGDMEMQSSSRFEEVDLNELDALLDDMLATAPVSGPGPTAAIAANGQADAPKAFAPAKTITSSDVTAPPHPDMMALQSQVDEQGALIAEQSGIIQTLQENLDSLSAEARERRELFDDCNAEVQELAQRFSDYGDRVQALEQAASDTKAETPAQGEAEAGLAEYSAEVQELAQRFSDASDKIHDLEQRFSEHSTEMQDLVQRFSGSCDQIQAHEQRLDNLAAASPSEAANDGGGEDPRVEALAGKVQQLEEQLAGQSARCQALESQVADLLAGMDKLAAETAARVIREELAALMQSL